MKLKELLIDIFSKNKFTYSKNVGEEYVLKDSVLETYKEDILKTDEFKNVDELIILKSDDVKTGSSRLVRGNIRYEGVVYLSSIHLTLEIYDPNNIKSVKNGCVITPLLYDGETFEAYKKIIIKFNPSSKLYDMFDELDLKKELREKLEQILESPDEYQSRSYRGILIVSDGKCFTDNDDSKYIIESNLLKD